MGRAEEDRDPRSSIRIIITNHWSPDEDSSIPSIFRRGWRNRDLGTLSEAARLALLSPFTMPIEATFAAATRAAIRIYDMTRSRRASNQSPGK